MLWRRASGEIVTAAGVDREGKRWRTRGGAACPAGPVPGGVVAACSLARAHDRRICPRAWSPGVEGASGFPAPSPRPVPTGRTLRPIPGAEEPEVPPSQIVEVVGEIVETGSGRVHADRSRPRARTGHPGVVGYLLPGATTFLPVGVVVPGQRGAGRRPILGGPRDGYEARHVVGRPRRTTESESRGGATRCRHRSRCSWTARRSTWTNA
jgi:hypothetical protein